MRDVFLTGATGFLGGELAVALSKINSIDHVYCLVRDKAGERAASLTQQLLAYSGKGKFVIQPVDLSNLARDMVSLIQTSIPRTVTHGLRPPLFSTGRLSVGVGRSAALAIASRASAASARATSRSGWK